MNSKNDRPLAILIIGIVISIAGILLLGAYIYEAYISKIGKPDQSLLFWYLPFLFFGLLFLAAGLSAGVWGFINLKKIKIVKPISLVVSLFLMIIIIVPSSFIVTILLVPFWSWLEITTGIESLGHSGPAEWCYGVVFVLIAAATSVTIYVCNHFLKNKQ